MHEWEPMSFEIQVDSCWFEGERESEIVDSKSAMETKLEGI
jgi:hypothetical protein